MKKVFLLTAGLYISQLIFAQLPAAYYPMNGNGNETSGNAPAGTLVNGVSIISDRNGISNNALSFSNGSQYLEANFLSSFSNNFSISCWVNPSGPITLHTQANSGSIAQSGNLFVLAPRRNGTSGLDADAGVGISVGTNGICIEEHAHDYLPSLLTYSGAITGWTFITITYSNKTPNLYINGVFVQTGLQSPKNNVNVCLTANAPGHFGGIGGGSPGNTGSTIGIDEFAVYNAVLTAQQIADLYSGGEICNGFDDDGDGLVDETCIPTVSIANKSITEGNSDTTDMKFAVTLNHPYDSAVSVRYKTANISATAGSDYLAANKVLRFSPGQVRKNITIGVLGDITPEPNEQFNVILSNPVNTILGAADTALGIIRNDDAAFAIVSNGVDDLKNIGVRISPNPAKDILQISGFNTDKNSIVITDLQGRIMLQQSIGRGSTTLNIAHLSAGIYLLTYTNGGAFKSIKILKQ